MLGNGARLVRVPSMFSGLGMAIVSSCGIVVVDVGCVPTPSRACVFVVFNVSSFAYQCVCCAYRQVVQFAACLMSLVFSQFEFVGKCVHHSVGDATCRAKRQCCVVRSPSFFL